MKCNDIRENGYELLYEKVFSELFEKTWRTDEIRRIRT
jgi:hypothetical protein